MLAIIHAELVMRDHLIPDAYLLVKDGIIQDLGEMHNAGDLSAYEILDVQGSYVGPGLVDIHTHAGGKDWFYKAPLTAAKYMLEHGTTTVLPVLYFSMNKEEWIKGITTIQEAMKKPEGSNIGGMYMEGPYLNPKFGADRENIPWKGPVCREDYQEVIEKAGRDVRVWVVAPEREGIEDFVIDAKAVNPEVRFSVGHSEASPQQVEKLMPFGLCIGTHHTNATGDLQKYPECRGVCVDEAVRYHSDIYAELICDKCGIHVDPYMLRLVRKIKGDERIILISDACVFDGPVPPGYEEATDILFDHSGEIAGSKLSLMEACRNMMKHTGASIVDVFNYASYNPAKAVGFTDRGEIRKGLRADLVIVDYKLQVQKVILKGEVQ